MGKQRPAAAPVVGRARTRALELEDRIARVRAGNPQVDPTGEHHVAIAAIARRTGRDVVDLLDLWDERATVRHYEGTDRATAEREAAAEIATMFPPAQGEAA